MSFSAYKEIIEENDFAMLYINFSTIIPLRVTEKTISKKGGDKIGSSGAIRVAGLFGSKRGLSCLKSQKYQKKSSFGNVKDSNGKLKS